MVDLRTHTRAHTPHTPRERIKRHGAGTDARAREREIFDDRIIWDTSGVYLKTPSDPRAVLFWMVSRLGWPAFESHIGSFPADENAWRRFIEDADVHDVLQVGLDLTPLWQTHPNGESSFHVQPGCGL